MSFGPCETVAVVREDCPGGFCEINRSDYEANKKAYKLYSPGVIPATGSGSGPIIAEADTDFNPSEAAPAAAWGDAPQPPAPEAVTED